MCDRILLCYSYHKFTRGKDLSRYSEKDLAAILGTPTGKTNNSDEQNSSNKNHINAGSMEDYFKKKQFVSKSSVVDNSGVNNMEEEEEEENSLHNVSETKFYKEQDNLKNCIDDSVKTNGNKQNFETMHVKSKGKKKKIVQNEEVESIEVGNIVALNLEGGKQNIIKKKRKSKNIEKFIVEENREEIINERNCHDINVENILEFNDDIQVNKKTFKKKKSKAIKDESIIDDNYENSEEKKVEDNSYSIVVSENVPKRKKKSKVIDNNVQDNDKILDGNKKPVKKKRRLEDANEEVSNVDNLLVNEYPLKNQKNLNKISETYIEEVKNTTLNENKNLLKKEKFVNGVNLVDKRVILENETIKQHKKLQKSKKQFKDLKEEGCANDNNNEICVDLNIENEEKRPKKKQKSKRREEKSILQIGSEICNEENEKLVESNNMDDTRIAEDNSEKQGSKKSKKTKSKKSFEEITGVITINEVCNKIKSKDKQKFLKINNNNLVNYKKKLDKLLIKGENAEENKKLIGTSPSVGETSTDFVSLNCQSDNNLNSINFTVNEENVDSNPNDYRGYNIKNKPINQYSYNNQWGNGGNHFQSNAFSWREKTSDVKFVKEHFSKYKLVISTPELNFNGSNISNIVGYGKTAKT